MQCRSRPPAGSFDERRTALTQRASSITLVVGNQLIRLLRQWLISWLIILLSSANHDSLDNPLILIVKSANSNRKITIELQLTFSFWMWCVGKNIWHLSNIIGSQPSFFFICVRGREERRLKSWMSNKYRPEGPRRRVFLGEGASPCPLVRGFGERGKLKGFSAISASRWLFWIVIPSDRRSDCSSKSTIYVLTRTKLSLARNRARQIKHSAFNTVVADVLRACLACCAFNLPRKVPLFSSDYLHWPGSRQCSSHRRPQ